jgi:hypothetical protein
MLEAATRSAKPIQGKVTTAHSKRANYCEYGPNRRQIVSIAGCEQARRRALRAVVEACARPWDLSWQQSAIVRLRPH